VRIAWLSAGVGTHESRESTAHVDAVRDEHLDRAALGGQRQAVRVAPEEQRPLDALRVR
jgi:hypothetical protein